MSLGLPPQPLLGRALLRAALVWLSLRFILWAGSRMANPPVPMPDAATGTPSTALLIALLTVLAVRFEAWRHGETAFLANLGVAFTPLAVLVAALSLAGDVALRMALN